MGNIPPRGEEQIVWFETRLPQWNATPSAFGLTGPQVTALTDLTDACRVAYNSAQADRAKAKNSTISLNSAYGDMAGEGRDLVRVMKAFIENSGNPALWGQAGLEPPAPPGTAPAPTAPFALSASLDSEGNLILRWKASQPEGVSGVVYSVRRTIDGGPFVLVDTVGGKEFVDDTVSQGTVTVAYTLQGKRGRQVSPLSESLTVRFGRQGPGLSIASVTTGPTAMTKLAA